MYDVSTCVVQVLGEGGGDHLEARVPGTKAQQAEDLTRQAEKHEFVPFIKSLQRMRLMDTCKFKAIG
jgi:hypothetical protein